MPRKAIDYLIVGQGLAGTSIGFRLEEAGHRVTYIDAPEQTAASTVAAGIVNPITGRRFVKSWLIDDLIPEARSFYAELEARLGVKIWYDLPLVRTLFNRGDENDWLSRGGDAGYQEYLIDRPDLGRIPEITQPAYGYAGVGRSARVDVGTLVEAYRKRLLQDGRFISAPLDYARISVGYEGVTVDLPNGQRRFDRLVFCEGWRARFNPWFGNLPHGGAKGEVLIVRTEATALDRMFKHRIFLVPRADGTYWIGATNANRFEDDSPTPASRRFLEERLREVMTVPYEILEHQSAVRPTVRDRRPLLGGHPEHPALVILNGLGTKGASLAPLMSRWLFDHLESGAELPEEVGISRF